MPVFEYKCEDCGRISEFLEKADIKAEHICPACGSKKMTKQISTFSAVVKQPAAANNKCRTCAANKMCPNSGF